jgi:excisionase family DNA binding protein
MWMTIDEAAQYLKVSKDTIYKMAQRGHIPASKLGVQWRFHSQKLDEWMDNQTRKPSSDVDVAGPENQEVIP